MINLPSPPKAYDAHDQAQMRRIISQALATTTATTTTTSTDLAASGDTTGATDTAAIQALINLGASFQLAAGVFYINANLTALTVASHGQTMSGAGAVASDGTGTSKTIIRPTVAVTTVLTIDGTAAGTYIQGFGVENLTIDMVNMTDASSRRAFNQIQAYDGHFTNVRVINDGTAKIAWLFSTGAYVTALNNCQGALVKFAGTLISNATTTVSLNNCDIKWIDANYAVNITLNGGAVQRPSDAAVPIVYLAPGTTPYGYPANTGGLYAAVMTKIDNVSHFTSNGCDWEQGGGYAGTYNDGTHGVLTLIRVIQVTANATNTTFVNPQFAGCYLLDAGVNTRVIGYQITGMSLTGGKDYHFGDIATSADVIGFTDFANYFGSGSTQTYSLAAATGALTVRKGTFKPSSDADSILTVKSSGGTTYLDVATNSVGAVNVYNGANLALYSDTGTTSTVNIASATGLATFYASGVETCRITAANGTFNTTTGYYNNGNIVVGPRITGWSAPTGSPSKATFATGSVTLPNLAAAVAQLINDLTTHGLIGA